MSNQEMFAKTWRGTDKNGKTVQAAMLKPLKKGAKFGSLRKTKDGHVWIRVHRFLLTDCDCFDLKTGK